MEVGCGHRKAVRLEGRDHGRAPAHPQVLSLLLDDRIPGGVIEAHPIGEVPEGRPDAVVGRCQAESRSVLARELRDRLARLRPRRTAGGGADDREGLVPPGLRAIARCSALQEDPGALDEFPLAGQAPGGVDRLALFGCELDPGKGDDESQIGARAPNPWHQPSSAISRSTRASTSSTGRPRRSATRSASRRTSSRTSSVSR